MDLEGLQTVLARVESGEIDTLARETPEPSPMSHEILNANPYAFLDDAPLEERRTRAVALRRGLPGRPIRAFERGAGGRSYAGGAGGGDRRDRARVAFMLRAADGGGTGRAARTRAVQVRGGPRPRRGRWAGAVGAIPGRGGSGPRSRVGRSGAGRPDPPAHDRAASGGDGARRDVRPPAVPRR